MSAAWGPKKEIFTLLQRVDLMVGSGFLVLVVNASLVLFGFGYVGYSFVGVGFHRHLNSVTLLRSKGQASFRFPCRFDWRRVCHWVGTL